MKLYLVNHPLQDDNTESDKVQMLDGKRHKWCVKTFQCREGDGGVENWFKQLRKMNPSIVYLYTIKSEYTQIMPDEYDIVYYIRADIKTDDEPMTNTFPIVRNVNAKTIAEDIQPVYPAEPSQDYSSVFEVKESKMPRTISGYHPYVVDATNIEDTKTLFNTEDVQIGDNVEEWDRGGWNALAGRAGISLMRNGVELKSKLTMMS